MGGRGGRRRFVRATGGPPALFHPLRHRRPDIRRQTGLGIIGSTRETTSMTSRTQRRRAWAAGAIGLALAAAGWTAALAADLPTPPAPAPAPTALPTPPA